MEVAVTPEKVSQEGDGHADESAIKTVVQISKANSGKLVIKVTSLLDFALQSQNVNLQLSVAMCQTITQKTSWKNTSHF